MRIPSSKIARFVRDLVEECLVSQVERTNRGSMFTNYFMHGSQNPSDAAIYNKTFTYIDDLESLLYSPISLRFHIGDPDIPNILNDAKGKSASARLRSLARQSEIDTTISQAVSMSLVKGKSLMKLLFKRKEFSPTLVQPELFGVLRENHTKLDEDMEAFVHSMWITRYQFERMIWDRSDRVDLMRKAKRYMKETKDGMGPADSAQKQVIVGGLYPFQPAGSGSPNNTRGIVDWMQAGPMFAPNQLASMMRLDELWVWDDEHRDWATFQQIGDDILIWGGDAIYNLFAYDPVAKQPNPHLIGHHPFIGFCPNHVDGYFWGRSEIVNVALLQEAINSRINGTNKLLRLQEDPPKSFQGSTGVNQSALARFNKPGGYWVDSNPNAKVAQMAPTIPGDLWASLHEYERMFDEMGGLPPIAKGRGEAGVRSGSHADTLVRMFSPRFKDRALIVERNVEEVGGLMLDLGRAHIDKKMLAWVAKEAAGAQAPRDDDPLLMPPVKGQVPVPFMFADLDHDAIVSVDAHSSSPAFSQDAKALVFDLVKLGAMSAEDALDHLDAPDPEELAAGVQRRALAKAEAEKADQETQIAIKTAGRAH